MTGKAWPPVLAGAAARQAWEAILDIGDALAADPGARPAYPSLASGSAGTALFLRRLAEARGRAGDRRAAAAHLDAAIDAMAVAPLSPGLYGGVAGISWTIRHLAGRGGDPAVTSELDELLIAALERPEWDPGGDLISGIVGLGLYGLEALPDPSARRCVEAVVERLDRDRRVDRDGVAWFTPPERLPDHERRVAPRGVYNLGVAHGVPAVLVLLAACCRAGIAVPTARRLLDGGMSWLLAQRLDPALGSTFASWKCEGVEPRRSRLAWCYGDPGVGAAILAAGRAVAEQGWVAAGVDVLRRAARRPDETSGVVDAGLCHGSAGLALIYARAYRATGDDELADAARRWYGWTLGLRRPGQGVAGFLSREADGSGGTVFQGVPGFLTGAAGIGLALLSAVAPIEPSWDRVLALSVA